MNYRHLFTGIVLAVSLGTGTGCLGDAARDNPLDPNSDRFVDEGGVEGQITDRAEIPLAGAEVHLVPGPSLPQLEFVTRTDAGGRFEITGAPSGSGYQLQASKEGYDARVVEALEVRAGVSEQLPVLRLNALPVFTGVAFRTVHISRWWPKDDLFFLGVNAEVEDADGLFDIDGVWFEIPDLNYTVALEPRTAGQFDALIRADSLPTANLQSLLGLALQLHVRDKEDAVVSSAPHQLVRVLEENPSPASPKDDVLLETSRPTFTWDPFPASFAFSYRIEVFRDEVNRAVLVMQSNPIPMDVTSFQMANLLPTGPYFWTITVIDTFGNQSRSKEAAFRIP